MMLEEKFKTMVEGGLVEFLSVLWRSGGTLLRYFGANIRHTRHRKMASSLRLLFMHVSDTPTSPASVSTYPKPLTEKCPNPPAVMSRAGTSRGRLPPDKVDKTVVALKQWWPVHGGFYSDC